MNTSLRCSLLVTIAVVCSGQPKVTSSELQNQGSLSDVKLMYFIHVDKVVRQEAHVQEQLHALGLSTEHFPGVAPERVAAGEFEAKYMQPQGLGNELYKLPPRDANAAVALFLTHVHALQKMFATLQPTEFGLIVEDDVIVHENWATRVEAAMNGAPKGWDVLKLAGAPIKKVDQWEGKSKADPLWWARKLGIAEEAVSDSMRDALGLAPSFTKLSETGKNASSGMGAYLVRSASIPRILAHLTATPIQNLETMLMSPSSQAAHPVDYYQVLPTIFNITKDAFPKESTVGVAVLAQGKLAQTKTKRDFSVVRKHTTLDSSDDSAYGSTEEEPVLEKPAASKPFDHPSWLSACKAIYLDVGSNIGVQVRKLFEPQWYPGSKVLPLFDSHLGLPESRTLPGNESSICALGLEPNPRRWEHLSKLQEMYKEKGWNVHFYKYGAWKSEGTMNFDEAIDPDHEDWGAHLRSESMSSWKVPGNGVAVRTVDLSAFVKSLPKGSVKLMKVDIETAEYSVIPRLIDEKVLCQGTIDMAFIEAHPWGANDQWLTDHSYSALKKVVDGADCAGTKVTEMVDLDDEAYMTDTQDLEGNPLTSVWTRIWVIVFSLAFLTIASIGAFMYLEWSKKKGDVKEAPVGGLGM